MKLELSIHLNTDGDFGIRDIDGKLTGSPLFDETNPMYKDVKIGYHYKLDGTIIDINLVAEGESSAQCQFAARDLMNNLVCQFEVLPSHYYLVKDLYNLVIDVSSQSLFKNISGTWRKQLFGNYEGSEVVISIWQ